MGKRFFWIATAFLFLFVAVEDWAFYRPWSRRLNRLHQAIGESQDQALGCQVPPDQLQRIKKLIEQNFIHGDASPSGKDYASQSLGELMAILRELEIELLSIVPGEVREEDCFVVSPFEIEVRCGYHQFRRLLEAMERSDGLIDIRRFQLSVVREVAVASLSVEIYLFKKDLRT